MEAKPGMHSKVSVQLSRVVTQVAGWLAGWLAGWVVGKSDFNENPVVRLDLDFDLGFVKSKKMQNIDETPPVISPTAILKRPPFLFFEVESWFWWGTLFWVVV